MHLQLILWMIKLVHQLLIFEEIRDLPHKRDFCVAASTTRGKPSTTEQH